MVREMRSRQIIRTEPNPRDKRSNPLIAIPGSPGIGKSTFLCHFPDSKAYTEYVGYNQKPIVSTLTFNSNMETLNVVKDAFGLRIIYGAALAMGLMSKMEWKWKYFVEQFPLLDLVASDAVRLLKQLLGHSRQILILVDEISKANNSVNVMAQLGVVLNEQSECDVVISSLSPGYVQELLTGSQRPVSYVVLPPMLDSGLGREECYKWADGLVSNIGVD